MIITGLSVAFLSWTNKMKMKKINTDEKLFDFSNLNDNQIFFISMAQTSDCLILDGVVKVTMRKQTFWYFYLDFFSYSKMDILQIKLE